MADVLPYYHTFDANFTTINRLYYYAIKDSYTFNTDDATRSLSISQLSIAMQ